MNIKWLLYLTLALILVILLSGCGTTATPTAPTALIPTTPAPPPFPSPVPEPTVKAATISLTWYGQSTFVLTTSTGLKALLDPTGPGAGYKIAPIEEVDLVTVSHEHSDHNDVGLATGSPTILRGLAGGDWAKIDQMVNGVRVRTVPTYHDDSQGSQLGKNAVFIFEVDGLRLAHLGDLGQTLTLDQIKAIGPVEVLLIPVGGYFTIDGRAAGEVVDQLDPRVVIPMHYKTPDLAPSLAGLLAPVDPFVAAIGDTAAITKAGQTITLDRDRLPAKRTVMVMQYTSRQ